MSEPGDRTAAEHGARPRIRVLHEQALGFQSRDRIGVLHIGGKLSECPAGHLAKIPPHEHEYRQRQIEEVPIEWLDHDPRPQLSPQLQLQSQLQLQLQFE